MRFVLERSTSVNCLQWTPAWALCPSRVRMSNPSTRKVRRMVNGVLLTTPTLNQMPRLGLGAWHEGRAVAVEHVYHVVMPPCRRVSGGCSNPLPRRPLMRVWIRMRKCRLPGRLSAAVTGSLCMAPSLPDRTFDHAPQKQWTRATSTGAYIFPTNAVQRPEPLHWG